MAVPPKIDRFNKATLVVFDALYQAFPVPLDLSASKIAMETLPPYATFDESFQSIEPVFHTIEFLRKEGFIEYGDRTLDGTTFLQARAPVTPNGCFDTDAPVLPFAPRTHSVCAGQRRR